jgi:Trp operon repressor
MTKSENVYKKLMDLTKSKNEEEGLNKLFEMMLTLKQQRNLRNKFKNIRRKND